MKGAGVRAEVGAGDVVDLGEGVFGRERCSVWAAGGHRVPGVGDREQLGAFGDRFGGQGGRVARGVPAFVVVADSGRLLVVEHAGGQAGAEVGVLADVLELGADSGPGRRGACPGARPCRGRAGGRPGAGGLEPVGLPAERLGQSRPPASCVHTPARARGSATAAQRIQHHPRGRGHPPGGTRRPHQRSVATERLGPVERLVGAPQQVCPGRARCERSQMPIEAVIARPPANGEPLIAARSRWAAISAALGGVVRQQPGELLAADPPHGVHGAGGAGDPRGGLGQHPVAGRVAVDVVDRLEVVEIDDDRGSAAAPARRSARTRSPTARGTPAG